MDLCNIFVENNAGQRRNITVNLNWSLGKFIERANIESSEEDKCNQVQVDGQVYGENSLNKKLKEIGLRDGCTVSLMTNFIGASD